jgi:hypothetical protein
MRQPNTQSATYVGDVALPVSLQGRIGCSISEACTALNLGRDRIYELINAGEPDGLTASRIGKRTIVHVASILRLLERTRITMKPRVRRIRQGAGTQPDATP